MSNLVSGQGPRRIRHHAGRADCDDSDATASPGAPELCDAVDNDCTQSTADECPAECVPVLRAQHAYLLCRTLVTYAEAESACSAQRMRLIKVEDLAENTWAHALLAGDRNSWLGATDAANEGEWSWADGQQLRTAGAAVPGVFQNWAPGEPNGGGVSENCAELWSGTGEWNDKSCDLTSFILCERY
jgi:Lectin C-type domain/Putative metal-binding motif